MLVENNLENAENLGAIPRGLKQLHDMSEKQGKKLKRDPLDNLVLLKSVENNSERYIRRITDSDDNYSICLYTNDQLKYLSKYCTGVPVHVDITFNLTNMFAVVTTFRASDFVGSPLLVGPILLTKKQRAMDYKLLWEAITNEGIFKRTSDVTFVTDGEMALINSINDVFENATLLRCTLHMLDNLRMKASQLRIPQHITTSIITDIRTLLSTSLINFDQYLESAKLRWLGASKENDIQLNITAFIKYINKQLKDTLKANSVECLDRIGIS